MRLFRSTECVRLKNFVTNAQIMDNTIKYCGVYDFAFQHGGQNGEGVYIGTSSTQVRRATRRATFEALQFSCKGVYDASYSKGMFTTTIFI